MSASNEARHGLALALMLGATLMPACRASESTRPTDTSAAGFADAPPDPLAELAQLEGRMRQLGLQPATNQPNADQPDASEPGEEKVDQAGEVQRTEDRQEDERPVDAGVQPVQPEPPPSPMAERDHEGESRCTSVCELSEAICELEVQICTMAKNHGGDPIYVDACERAVDDCELSGDACDTCVE